jgi:DNA-binding NtrC family response regulator
MNGDDIEDNDTEDEKAILSLTEARDLLDIIYIINALFQNNGNITHAAEELEIGRRTMYDFMEKYDISCTDGILCIKLKPTLQHIKLRLPFVEKYLKNE